MSEQKFHLPEELKAPSVAFQEASRQIGLFWWHWNQKERKIQVVPELLKKLGIKPEEFDNSLETVYSRVHPDDVPKNRKRCEALIRGETEMYEIEYRVKNEAGEWKWFYNRGVVNERDASGEPVSIGGITIEISGEFQHLLTMVEEKDKFEFIFRNSTEAVLIFEIRNDRIARISDANQAARELFGMHHEDFKEQLPRVFGTDGMKDAMQLMLRQIGEQGFAHLEQALEIEGEDELWLEITAYRFSLTGQEQILAIASDKTTSRKTEAALRETEKLYRILFEAANDRIGLFTTEGKALLLNDAFHRTIGYSREEFLAMNNQESIHPEDRIRLRSELGDLFQHGSSGHEYRVMHKDGHLLHMSSKAVLIPGENGEDLVLLIIRDVSDRKKFIGELEDAKRAAEESNRLKSEFLANMSHEIRTPMNSIVGFSNLLVEDNLNEETRKTYVERIVRNSELLLVLISDIVDLAKIESGQLPLIYGPLKVAELMEELKGFAMEELRRRNKKQLEVVVDQQDLGAEMEIDVIRLSQVMKNLINNAIKFTDQGSITLGIRTSPGENRILFQVRDTGIGIDSVHFGLIFEQFRQLDGSDTRKFGGTGLGLTISKKLVELMGGRIWVESAAGEGALFQVELPVSPCGIEGDMEQGEITEPAGPGIDGELFIMVVDDEPDSVVLLEQLISSMGYRVTKAPNGYEALKYLEQSAPPDIIMMDVEMPVLNGTDVLHIIRNKYPQIKVIAQSAHALHGDRKRFMEEGFDEYLPKPYSIRQLSEAIASLALKQ